MSDVERLAGLIVYRSPSFPHQSGPSFGAVSFGLTLPELAKHILASDWLAEHVATARAEERERIARGIEAQTDPPSRYDTTAVRGRRIGMQDAARIARQEPTE